MKKIALAASLLALSASPAWAQATATTTGTANATVIQPIAITHDANASLNFGAFTPGTGGTVIVTAAGSRTPTGDVGVVPSSAASADSFTVSGDTNRTFSITTASSEVSNGSAIMAFTTTPSTPTGTLANGSATFKVGGTLSVAANQAVGSYTGSYNATVAYN